MKRTKDVLEHVRSFHDRLADYYSRLEHEAERERIRLLLDYLSRHERHLAEALGRLEELASRAVLDTWFQFTPDLGPIKESAIRSDMSCDEVVSIALTFDDEVIDLYREMARRAESREVRELFENLVELETGEEHQVTRNALFLRDY